MAALASLRRIPAAKIVRSGIPSSTTTTADPVVVTVALPPLRRKSTAVRRDDVDVDVRAEEQRYARERRLYREQVSALRKRYAQEIAEKRAAEQAREAADRAAVTARRRERQRLKNLRSIKSAKREIEKRAARAKEFERELEVAQKNRDARNERYRAARQLLINELEEEAPLWMTTREEVDAALSGRDNVQKLWAAPCLVGAAPPDAAFWRYETHAMPKLGALPTKKELALERIEEDIHAKTNMDPNVWTEERVQETIGKMEKAKLRALVQNAGRNAIINRHNEAVREKYLGGIPDMKEQHKDKIPPHEIVQPSRKLPAPNMKLLVDYEAMEEEGAKILMENPGQFFVFDDHHDQEVDSLKATNKDNKHKQEDFANAAPTTTTRGRPVSLKHEFGHGFSDHPYPTVIGREIPPDTRTARERKRAQKEEERAARRAEAAETDEEGTDFEFEEGEEAVEKESPEGPAWVEAELTRLAARNEIMSRDQLERVPHGERLYEEDLDWIAQRLQERSAQIDVSMDIAKKDLVSGGGSLSKEEMELLAEASVVTDKLTEAQAEALGALDLEEVDGGHEEQVLLVESTLGKGVLTKEELDTIVRLEQELVKKKDLVAKLFSEDQD